MNETGTGVFDRILEIATLIHQDMNDSFAGTGLNQARVHLMWELHRLGPSTQQALAGALGVTPANVTGLVDALESHGFVQRRRHPDDRRKTLVTLTGTGDETMRAMARNHERFATALVDRLAPAELDAFAATLDTVAERLAILVRDGLPAEEER